LTTVEIIAALQSLDPSEMPKIAVAVAARWAEAASPNRTAAETDELLSASEAAKLLSMSVSFLYHNRNIPCVKLGARRMYSRQALQKFIHRQSRA
jgi:hypothetical protein